MSNQNAPFGLKPVGKVVRVITAKEQLNIKLPLVHLETFFQAT